MDNLSICVLLFLIILIAVKTVPADVDRRDDRAEHLRGDKLGIGEIMHREIVRTVADVLGYTQQGVGFEVAFLHADAVEVDISLSDVRLGCTPQTDVCREKVKHRHFHVVVSVELLRLAAEDCLMVFVLEFHFVSPFRLFLHKKSTHRFCNDEC